jgi:hypothetical protein
MDLSGYSFLDGQLVNDDIGFLLAIDDSRAEQRVDHGIVLQYHAGQWQLLEQDHKLISCTFAENPTRQLVALAENGFVTALGGGMIVNESVFGGEDEPPSRGPLVEVRAFAGGRAYGVGTCRQAYRRDGPNAWVRVDQTAQSDEIEISDTCFHSIDGFSGKEIYSVGWEGEIWHFDGVAWEQSASPTNCALYKVLCCEDGFVYAVGQSGLLIKGRGNSWEVVEQDETEEDFWGLGWFKGRLYIASLNFIYTFDDKGLSSVDMGDFPIPATCLEFTASDNRLWSIGAKDVVQFDGESWSRII